VERSPVDGPPIESRALAAGVSLGMTRKSREAPEETRLTMQRWAVDARRAAAAERPEDYAGGKHSEGVTP